MEVEFLDGFKKNTHILNFMKTCPVEAELFHVDSWTDMAKLISAFRNFVNVSDNYYTLEVTLCKMKPNIHSIIKYVFCI